MSKNTEETRALRRVVRRWVARPIGAGKKIRGGLWALALSVVVCSEAADTGAVSSRARALTQARERPSLFVTATPKEGLRSLAEVRRGIQSDHARRLWDQLLAKVNREAEQPPLAPASGDEASLRNRDFVLVATTANRILDTALVALILEDRRYVEAALRQIDALFDPTQWPEWRDQAHIDVGLNADLRHGQLVVAVALAYDWMHGLMTSAERRRIVEGLDRCAMEPFRKGVAAQERWSRLQSNWMTVIMGGFGIAGMALGPDYEHSAWLVEKALPRMADYLGVIGPEGEFNETVQYAGSMGGVVQFFTALRYAGEGRETFSLPVSLAKFYRWYLQMTFPPGHVAGFGDPAPDMPPVVGPVAAVAAAIRDPRLQWFYLTYCDQMLATHRQRALEMLSFDADLEATSPRGSFPLGRAYHHEGKLISSRSTWGPEPLISAVYAKAGRETHHSHADWGQVCIDGYGERLVVDLKASYPRSDKERYYDQQQWGHNVFVFGENDTGGVSWRERRRTGTIAWSRFDDSRGGAWTMDLTEVYDGAKRVTRTVIHAVPRVVVVLDEAELAAPQDISLRWHLARLTEPRADGTWVMEQGAAVLAGGVFRLDGPSESATGRHRYVPPYDRDRLGAPLPQRHEPYIELRAKGARCRVLSLFGILPAGQAGTLWQSTPAGWRLETPEGELLVSIEGNALRVGYREGAELWQIPLPTTAGGG